MLTPYLKRLLNELIAHTSTPNELYGETTAVAFFKYLGGDDNFSKPEKSKIYDAILYLDKIGYLEFRSVHTSVSEPFHLTYEGRHYKSFTRLRAKRFLMESIFTPIAISAITTVIGLLLAGLL